MKLRPLSLVLFTALFAPQHATAQGTRSDYERAFDMRRTLSNKVFKERLTPKWFEDNRRFWYRNDLPDDKREFIVVDVDKGSRLPAFDHVRMAKILSEAAGLEVPADKLPLEKLQISAPDGEMRFTAFRKQWKCSLRSYGLSELDGDDDTEAAGALEAGYRIRPSRRRGEDTHLTFSNRSKSAVEVYWIDEGGQRRHYASIPSKGKHRQHTYGGHVWLVMEKEGERGAVYMATDEHGEAVIKEETLRKDLIERRSGRRGRDRDPQVESPDGKWVAFIKDHNLHVRDVKKGKEIALSEDGTEGDAYEARFSWSPDSKKLVAMRVKEGEDREVFIIESAPQDQLQPKLHSYRYRKPGDAVDHARPQLFHVSTKRHTPVADRLFPNPWSLSRVHWSPDSGHFFFLYNQRGHQVLRMIRVDADTGEARAVIDEQSKTFIDYAGKQFHHFLDATGEIIWMSERDGWNHLYLCDTKTGRVKNAVTKGPWVVRRVENVDDAGRQVWFWAGGIRPGQDPYYQHLCRVNFDGSDLEVLTEGNGTHRVTFSPDRKCFVDQWSRIDQPPVHELRDSEDGRLICELERADWSPLLEKGWTPPEPFTAKGRDGETDIYGIIIRPIGFDPSRKYPVIEQIYAGPHSAHVPKSFNLLVRQNAMATLGFIVVQIDGMGTSLRSKAFHDVCWKNLGDSGFPDRMLWLKAAAEKYPYMDLERVGIYGGSAGGQSALRALLAHGDFYKAAVADCGCHDNRMDKIWWNELWMSWPIGPHYEEQSNVAQAHKLEGKLLLTVGELDRNVDPASTLQVVDALIKADKDFDLLIVPGRGHGVGEIPYASRRRADFFVRHLLGVEPRAMP